MVRMNRKHIQTTVNDFVEIVAEVESLVYDYERQEDAFNKMLMDFQHYTEFNTFTRTQSRQMKMIEKKILAERRRVKDEITVLQDFAKWAGDSGKIIQQLFHVRDKINRQTEYVEDTDRRYKAKILPEIFGDDKVVVTAMEMALRKVMPEDNSLRMEVVKILRRERAE